MPGAGNLDRRVILERATVTRDSYNAPVKTWSELATVWAERVDASTAERFRAQEVGAEITRRFRIRWSTFVKDLNPADRLIYDGVEHQITGVRQPQGTRNRWIEIDCVARDDVAAKAGS